MVHKTDIIIILAQVIPVSYKCISNIGVPYISSNSWLTYEIVQKLVKCVGNNYYIYNCLVGIKWFRHVGEWGRCCSCYVQNVWELGRMGVVYLYYIHIYIFYCEPGGEGYVSMM